MSRPMLSGTSLLTTSFKSEVETAHDLNHLLADGADLGALSIAGLLDLVRPLLGESNTEKTEKEAISGAYINIGFNESLPLLHHGAKFVSGKVHAVEVGEDVAALDLLS